MADILNKLDETTATEKGMRKWTGDKKIVLSEDARDFLAWAKKHPNAARRMPVVDIRESIGADAFDSITLDRMHKRLLKGYQEWTPTWPKIVSTTTSISDFRTRYAIMHGSFGRLPQVPEKGPYLEVAFSDDQITYTPAKYGSTFGYSFEAQTYDDLGLLEKKVQKLGAAAARTLDYFVWYTLIDSNPTSYDGSTSFFDSSTWGNVESTAGLNYERLKHAYQLMLQQTDLDSNAAMFIPKYLVVHPAQALTARELTMSPLDPDTANNTKNVLQGQLEVIVTPFLTSTNWYLVADPSQADTVEIGLWHGSAEPEFFYENPDSGHAFDFDEIRMRVRLCFGGVALDPRAFVKGTVS